MVNLCCAKNIPHNIFFTHGFNNEANKSDLRCFLFLRKTDFDSEKTFTNHLNIAFCELSGYISLGSEEIYDEIDEKYVLKRIVEEIRDDLDDFEDELFVLYERNKNKF